MAALFLTIFCSTAIALILKYNEIKSGNIIILLVGNYFVATLIGFYFFQKSSGDISLFTALFGLMLSFMFVFSFFAFAKGVRAAGTALASLSARLSVLIPVILSMIVFDELPTVWQVAGLFFAVWTIVAFSVSSKKNPHRRLSRNDYFFLAALLIGIGLNDFCMKIFQQVQPMSEKPFFLLMIFGFSFFLTARRSCRESLFFRP
ncbi:hypothetical protein B6D60_03165 [candidate division KSB1 bacterium 4484_87]|nr:MAG: hypothetical protein B6D60_03165 [candidate division KSB1 bacterium 4484_87]